jgi:D-alanyl-D-alanine carboxypeptidase/D-alanyl-D-alanine-endopeptidase (penicillin-binding protein 4)
MPFIKKNPLAVPRFFVFGSLLATVAMAAGPVPAAQKAEREALKQAMQSVIDKSPLKTARVTVQARSLDDGTVVFSRDADELINPASNVKLFTAAAAMSRLGPEYRFETEFLTDQDFKEGKAKTLFIRGKGDPTVSTERLYGIVSELVHAGLGTSAPNSHMRVDSLMRRRAGSRCRARPRR